MFVAEGGPPIDNVHAYFAEKRHEARRNPKIMGRGLQNHSEDDEYQTHQEDYHKPVFTDLHYERYDLLGHQVPG